MGTGREWRNLFFFNSGVVGGYNERRRLRQVPPRFNCDLFFVSIL